MEESEKVFDSVYRGNIEKEDKLVSLYNKNIQISNGVIYQCLEDGYSILLELIIKDNYKILDVIFNYMNSLTLSVLEQFKYNYIKLIPMLLNCIDNSYIDTVDPITNHFTRFLYNLIIYWYKDFFEYHYPNSLAWLPELLDKIYLFVLDLLILNKNYYFNARYMNDIYIDFCTDIIKHKCDDNIPPYQICTKTILIIKTTKNYNINKLKNKLMKIPKFAGLYYKNYLNSLITLSKSIVFGIIVYYVFKYYNIDNFLQKYFYRLKS